MVVLIVVPKLLLHSFCLPIFSYVVNECCMKSLRPAFCWKWTSRSVLRATTTTTTTIVGIEQLWPMKKHWPYS